MSLAPITLKRSLAPLLAIAALAQAPAAQAAQVRNCVAPADLTDTMIYVMPIAYDAARVACAGQFNNQSFFAGQGERFIGSFRARQNGAWPGAFRTLKLALAEQNGNASKNDIDLLAMAQSLPEASLRPFVDGLVGQMIAKEIKPSSCGKIERGMELVSPLPVENVAGLMGFVLELVDLGNPAICAADLPKKKR